MVFTTAGGGANQLDTGYNIDNSLRFNYVDSADLRFTPSSAGTEETFTISAWIKKTMNSANSGIGGQDCYLFSSQTDSNNRTVMGVFGSSGTQGIFFENKVSGTSSYVDSAATFRDPSAWMHCVWAIDTTQSTDTNRVKLYVNGSQISSFDSTSYPAQNTVTQWSRAQINYIGSRAGGNYYDGYLSEVHVIDGQQLAPTEFGETDDNGVWIPKEYEGTYGNNGFFLKFADSSDGGVDSSGNGNNFTATNLTAQDNTTDTPTNNFCTMNPLIKSTTSSVNKPTYSEGNCLVTNHPDGDCSTLSTMGVANGRWYFEAKFEKATTDVQGYPQLGWAKHGNDNDGGHVGFNTPDGSNYRGKVDATVIANAFDGAPAANDIIGFYLDVDNGTLIVHQNGSDFMGSGALSGLDFSSTTFDPDIGFFQVKYNSNSNIDHSIQFNFGNPTFSISSSNADANGYGSFEYSPTLSGTNYYALCTKNLAEFG